MSQWEGHSRGAAVLQRRAIRLPLPDVAAERAFAERMARVADARERKADLLADPDVPLLEAQGHEIEVAADVLKRHLEDDVGVEDYAAAAAAYDRCKRDDPRAEAAAYCVESIWLMEQRTTINELLYAPIVLRYPDCVTINVRIVDTYRTPDSVVCECPEHSDVALDEEYVEAYYADSAYSQREAAERIRETANVIREEFKHPDEAAAEEREYGGFVYASGRRGSEFSDHLTAVTPDPDRFDGPADGVGIVADGPEAERLDRTLFAGNEVLA